MSIGSFAYSADGIASLRAYAILSIMSPAPTDLDPVAFFGREPTRIAVAWECRREPATSYAIAGRIHRAEGGIQSVLKTLEQARALWSEPRKDGRARLWHFTTDPEWAAALDEAERRASTGLLREGVRLIMVPATGIAEAWRLLSAAPAHQEVVWAAECPGSIFGLLLAVDERDTAMRADRLVVALQGAGVPAVSVFVRAAIDRGQLSVRAAELRGSFDSSLARDLPRGGPEDP